MTTFHYIKYDATNSAYNHKMQHFLEPKQKRQGKICQSFGMRKFYSHSKLLQISITEIIFFPPNLRKLDAFEVYIY